MTKSARTPEQKARHAESERLRRQAKKAIDERTAADDFVADTVAAAIISGSVSFTDAATALLSGATLEDVAGAIVPNDVHDVIAHHFDQDAMPTEAEVEASAKPVDSEMVDALLDAVDVAVASDLSEMDTITLYRNVQEEVAARRTNPEIATPHLDELNARKGRKVIAGKPEKAARKTTVSKRPARHPLFEQAEAERKRLANKRGKGTKVSSDEIVEVARRLSAAGLVERQAMEVAYWVEKLAVSRGAWAKAWTAATTPAQEGAAI